ncbi:MAG: multidrug effflux MFS transporter [Pseudomonadota bacterium]
MDRALTPPNFSERVALMATLISLVALSIDAILPALPDISRDLSAASGNSVQLVISALLLGLSFGQLVSGPLSDSFGRRPVIQAGLCIFSIGSLLSMIATDFETMLLGRFLQGVGAAGPRVVTLALVRDQFDGRSMARVMSFVMAVFILVPALAPALGQGILFVGDWRTIFVVFLWLSALALLWFTLRQPETHPPEKRVPFSFKQVGGAMGECIAHPVSLGYMITSGIVFGSFVGFLTSVQPIFGVIYDVTVMFPVYFCILALAIGAASVVNARLVMKFGMRRLSNWALHSLIAICAAGLITAWVLDSGMPLWVFMALLMPAFFCFGILFGNFNAIAMEPMGHIAGSAAAIIAAVTSLLAVSIGTLIGQSFNGTVIPLFAGYVICGLAAVIVISISDRRNSMRRARSSRSMDDGP